MLKEKLTNKKYYLDNMSMFLKESYGVEEQLDMFVDWLKSMDNLADVSISCLNIWNPKYKNDLKRKISNDEDFKPLDNLASLIGISRETKIYYYVEGETKPVYEILHFSNDDLIDLIKINIIQNNYKGTTKELIDLYQNKLNYNIWIVPSLKTNTMYKSAYCDVYLEVYKRDGTLISENIQKMFKYSNLFLRSLGIEYNALLTTDISNILKLDTVYNDETKYAVYPDNFTPSDTDNVIVLG